MRGTSALFCLCGFGAIILSSCCPPDDGSLPGYGDACKLGRPCSTGRCIGGSSGGKNDTCSGQCRCMPDDRKCRNSLVQVELKFERPENPNKVIFTYATHEHHGYVKLQRLCVTYVKSSGQKAFKGCRRSVPNDYELSLEPNGRGYELYVEFNNTLENKLITLNRTSYRPSEPKNIETFTDAEGTLTVQWTQGSDVKESECILDSSVSDGQRVKGQNNTCRFFTLPPLVPFRSVLVRIFNDQGYTATAEHTLQTPHTFIPRVVENATVEKADVSYVEFLVKESVQHSDVSAGFFVIGGTNVGCTAFQITPICTKPEALEACKPGVSHVLEASGLSTEKTPEDATDNATLVTAPGGPSSIESGSVPLSIISRSEQGEAPPADDSGIVLRVEGLKSNTTYRFHLTPWFCNNTEVQGNVTTLPSVSTRAMAPPQNITTFTDVDGILTVQWTQEGDAKDSVCTLEGADQGTQRVKGGASTCRFPELPALKPFQNVNIQISDEHGNQATGNRRLHPPHVFVPRVVKEVRVKEVGVSFVEFLVNVRVQDSDVNIGFFVINGTEVGCDAFEMTPTCTKPKALEACKLGVSHAPEASGLSTEKTPEDAAGNATLVTTPGGSPSTVSGSVPLNSSVSATPTTIRTSATATAAWMTPPTGPQTTMKRGGEATKEDDDFIFRVEGLDSATAYHFQLTPWFCSNTNVQGVVQGATHSSAVSTLVVAEKVTPVSENGTQILVSWQTLPATETIHYTVFLTDPTLGTQAETWGTQCSNSSSHEAAHRTELCNVSYNPGSSNGTCRGFAPDAFWEYGVSVEGRTEHGCIRVTSTSSVTTRRAAPGRVSGLNWWTKKNDSRHCGGNLLNDHYKLCLEWQDPSPRQQRNYIVSYIYTLAQGQEVIKSNNQPSHDPDVKPSDKQPGQGLKSYYNIFNVTPGEEYNITVYAIGEGGLEGEKYTIVVEIPDVHRPDLSQDDVAQLLLDDSVQKTDTTIEFKVNNTLFLRRGENGGNITGRGVIVTAGGKHPLECHASDDFQQYLSWSNRTEAMRSHGYRVKEAVLETPSAQPVKVKIGDGDCEKETYCDGPLEKGQDYSIWLYVCNEEDCVQVILVNETTTSDSDKALNKTQAVVMVLCFCVFIVVCVYLAWRFCFRSKSGSKRISRNPEALSEWQTLLDLKDPRSKRPMKLLTLASIICSKQYGGCLLLKEEFWDIVQSQTDPSTRHLRHKPHHTGLQETNRSKNRVNDIVTYEHSRVELTRCADGSDYINANFIPGFYTDKDFIATQGPLPYTVNDFWRMAWEQDVHVIVMLTLPKEGGKIKCEQYWPAQNGEMSEYGDIRVTNMSTSAGNDDYNITVFIVEHCKGLGTRRQVMHFQYLKWKDMATELPEDSVLEFHRAVRQAVPPGRSGPIIVHCSGGVGRTGAFIALDFIQRTIAELSLEQDLDIYGYVTRIREYRCNLIENAEQYIFIHRCARMLIAIRQEAEDGNGRESCVSSTSAGFLRVSTERAGAVDPMAGRTNSRVTFAFNGRRPGSRQI